MTTPRTDTLLVQLGKPGANSRFVEHAKELERELTKLNAVVAAAKNLVSVKGRFHSEQAYNDLVSELESLNCHPTARAR